MHILDISVDAGFMFFLNKHFALGRVIKKSEERGMQYEHSDKGPF